MTMLSLESGPFVRAIGWTGRPDVSSTHVATCATAYALPNPFEFSGSGTYHPKDPTPPACPTEIPLNVMRSSGVARARSAAKATLWAALLGKSLLATVPGQARQGERVGVAVASSSSITPVAWEFETVGLLKGWNKTDTLLLPSSIPSAIATQISAAFQTHAAAIAFQDGLWGMCAAMEHAHLSFLNQRADHFAVIAADEVCTIQCRALAALGDLRPWTDGASGVLLSKEANGPGEWQLALCGIVKEGQALELPSEWGSAAVLDLEIAGRTTLFSAPLFAYALQQLFAGSSRRAVLKCRLAARGVHVLGFIQHL